METENNNKPIYKKWWFWLSLLVLVFGGFAFAWVSGHKKSETKEIKQADSQQQPQGELAHILDPSLPTCPSNLTGIFNHEIYDLNDLDFVVPLGRVDAGVHTIPTDHIYINHLGNKRIAINAPTDMTLVAMDDKMTYMISDDRFLQDDYSIEFAPCRGLSVFLNHLSEINPKIKSAFDNSRIQCDDQKIIFGTNATTYYKACQSQIKLDIKSGEQLGYIGSFVGGSRQPVTGIDLGVYDLNSMTHNFANPDRYTAYNLHSVCGINLFTDNIKNVMNRKFGNLNQDMATVTWRTGEPLCGTDMQDVKGTVAGNWFYGPPLETGPTNTRYYLALVHDVGDFSKGALSWQGQKGNSTSTFTPLHSGTIDREFSEIRPDGQVYCYNTSSYIKGKVTPKVLIELVDETHLKIESQSGTCGASESFVEPYIYER